MSTVWGLGKNVLAYESQMSELVIVVNGARFRFHVDNGNQSITPIPDSETVFQLTTFGNKPTVEIRKKRYA